MPRVYLSGREAADVLAGAGLCRRQSRRVLAAGLAGEPVVTGRGHRYSEGQVRGLVERPHVTIEQLDEIGTSLVFVARRLVDVRAPEDEQLAAASTGWDLGLSLGVLIRARARQEGFVPLLATVGGFIALGADIVDVRGCRDGSRRNLVLEPAGEWFRSLWGHRLTTGPGRDYVLYGWTPGRPVHILGSRQPGPVAGVGESSHPTPEENA